MKITAIHTIALEHFPNPLWVEIETDRGIAGLGETYCGPEAVSGYVHATAAPYLLGQNPLQINKHMQALDRYVGFNSISAEMRGNSAINIALWDILGQASGQPIHQLLGGRFHDSVAVCNTCASYGYNRTVSSPAFNLHGKESMEGKRGIGAHETGLYEDLQAFHERPGELARHLLDEGISMMKIWPFDQFAGRYNGQWIASEDLDKGESVFQAEKHAGIPEAHQSPVTALPAGFKRTEDRFRFVGAVRLTVRAMIGAPIRRAAGMARRRRFFILNLNIKLAPLRS